MELAVKELIIKYFKSQKQQSGFTLIELLVVLIIIGILTALGLPYFLSRAASAKQSEAQQFVSSINRTQLAYRSEYGRFSESFNKLAVGSLNGDDLAETSNYSYKIAADVRTSSIGAQPKDGVLKGYYGATLQSTNGSGNAVLYSIICEAQSPGTDLPGVGTFGPSLPMCPDNYLELSR